MDRLTERQHDILKHLYKSILPVDLQDFIDRHNVSKRTLQYDLAEIKQFLHGIFNVELNNKRGKGYFLSPNDKTKLMSYMENDNDRFSQRSADLIINLALSNASKSIDDLSSEMFFSSSTIRNIIKDINNETEIKIDIDRFKNLYFDMEEFSIRVQLSKILTEDYFKVTKEINNYKLIRNIDNKIKHDKVINLMNSFNDINRKYNIWISNYAYIKVAYYIIVSYIRNSNGKYIKEIKDETTMNIEFKYSEEIVKNVDIRNYQKEESLSFMRFILMNGIFIDTKKIDDSIFNLTIDEMIEYFKSVNINEFNYENLRQDISRHLYQFIKRNKSGFVEDENPLLREIKHKYNYYFELAKDAYRIFQTKMVVDYSESEISYIAIYLYKNSLKNNYREYNIITVCGTGRGLAKLLQTRIENTFSNINVIKNVSSYYVMSKPDLYDIDFIVTTVDLPNLEIDTIKVSSILTAKDIRNIQDYIDYGSLYDSVPFKSKMDLNISDIKSYYDFSKLYADIFLKLYDSILNLPEDYKVNEEKMLGLTIHLILAIPRLINPDDEINNEIEKQLYVIESDYNDIYKIMNEYFLYLENKLNIKIAAVEKYAFYQYIINKEV